MFSLTLVYCSLSFALGVFLRKASVIESFLGAMVFFCVCFTVQMAYHGFMLSIIGNF